MALTVAYAKKGVVGFLLICGGTGFWLSIQHQAPWFAYVISVLLIVVGVAAYVVGDLVTMLGGRTAASRWVNRHIRREIDTRLDGSRPGLAHNAARFGDEVAQRLISPGCLFAAALCGKKGGLVGHVPTYYGYFFTFAKQFSDCETVARVLRCFLPKHDPEHWILHADKPGVVRLKIHEADQMRAIEREYPGLQRRSKAGLGFVLFVYDNRVELVVHERQFFRPKYWRSKDRLVVRQFVRLLKSIHDNCNPSMQERKRLESMWSQISAAVSEMPLLLEAL